MFAEMIALIFGAIRPVPRHAANRAHERAFACGSVDHEVTVDDLPKRRARVLAGRCVAKSLPARTRARRWVRLIFKDHQPTGWLENIPASRE